VDEAGLPNFYTRVWNAIWAPKGTPKNVIARINAAIVDGLSDSAVRQRLADLGQQIALREQQTPVGLDWQVAGFGNFSGNPNETDMIMRNGNTGAGDLRHRQQCADQRFLQGAVGLNWNVVGTAADPPTTSNASLDNSNQVAQLMQAMAGFTGSSGAGDSLNTAPLSADTSQQTLLTTPQHA
jgi:hypothetical protein